MFLPKIKSKEDEDISILVNLDNHSFNYLFDCGYASELTVRDCQNIKAIFISHTHIDHFINFDFILRHQIGTGNRITICGPEGITEQIQSKIRGYQWNLIEQNAITYEIREIRSDGIIRQSEIAPPKWDILDLAPRQLAGIYGNEVFDVNFVILDHKTNSIAYHLKEKDRIKIDMAGSTFKGGSWVRALKSAFQKGNDSARIEIEGTPYEAKDLFHLLEIKPGDTLGVIMDHAASEANHQKIKQLFANCNTVFIECFYNSADKELATLNYHSYTTQSANVLKACRVKNAIPVHFSRKYNEADIQLLKDEFYKTFS